MLNKTDGGRFGIYKTQAFHKIHSVLLSVRRLFRLMSLFMCCCFSMFSCFFFFFPLLFPVPSCPFRVSFDLFLVLSLSCILLSRLVSLVNGAHLLKHTTHEMAMRACSLHTWFTLPASIEAVVPCKKETFILKTAP